MKRVLQKFKLVLILIVALLFCLQVQAQDTASSDTTHKEVRQRKNTLRFNVTNPFIFGDKALIFGYERTIGNHQSISVNFGRAYYPQITSGPSDSIQLGRETKDNGINISFDYRFYLHKENKYPAPRGVYIGPYYSYNHFTRTNDWILNTADFKGDVKSNFAFDIHTVGFELGYQFVFWDRVSLDMILFGPGIASYKITTRFDTTLSSEDLDLLYSKVENYLETRFPGYEFIRPPGEQTYQGTMKTTGAGFRYMVMVGFRF